MLLDVIDEMFTIIASLETGDKAKVFLMDKSNLSDKQSVAILDSWLGWLTGLERDKVESEYKDVEAAMLDYTDILAKPERVYQIIYDERFDI